MRFGFLGHAVDFGGAVADRNDEARRGAGIVGHLAGGLVLRGHRAVDVVEYRADRLDRLRDTMHGIDRARGVALQRLDLLADLLGGALGLHRERLHFGGDHGKTAPGFAGTRRLDGGVERQQRGLPRDLRDQVDDIADRRRRLPQAIDVDAGLAGGVAGLVGELAGVVHLRADALRRMGELVGGLRKGRRRGLRGAGAFCQGIGALADGGKGGRGGLGTAGNRSGGTFELADHAAEFELQQFKDFLRRVAVGGDRVGRRHGCRRLGLRGRLSRFRHSLSKQTERHEGS